MANTKNVSRRLPRGSLLRALLIQSAKKLLQVENPLQKWGLAVAARRGRNRACVAVARKLCVALWHLLMGHPIGALEPVRRREVKLGKLATELALKEIKAQGYESKASFIEKKLYLLRSYP
jgi:ABC-type taurine transport system ATPase subunit